MTDRVVIDARGIHYTPLNKMIRQAVRDGAKEIELNHVLGQRFIGNGLRGDVLLIVNGIPGGDLAMFMSGPTCMVHGNGEHAPGNTMDDGRLIIYGNAGDATGHSMRGGEIYVRDNIGYRGGIHMKEYTGKRPVIIVGGATGAFLGEYMAGGLLIVLNRGNLRPSTGRGIGSGIHAGEIFLRGEVDDHSLGVGARKMPFSGDDRTRLTHYIENYGRYFGIETASLIEDEYTRIAPASTRPFAGQYTWE